MKSKKDTHKTRKVAIIVAVVIFALACTYGILFGKPVDSVTYTQPERVPTLGMTFEEFDSAYLSNPSLTDMQRDELWDSYKGKQVEWQGIVKNIDKNLMRDWVILIQHKQRTPLPGAPLGIGSDVTLELLDEELSKAGKLSVGDTIRYKGILSTTSIGGNPYLKEGELLTPIQEEVRVVSPTDTNQQPITPTTIISEQESISVPGDEAWYNTGLQVESGMQINFVATGLVKVASSGEGVSPDGVDPAQSGANRENLLCPLTRANYMLVGKVGNKCFEIGSESQITITENGNLFLAVNDLHDGFMDNSGYWEVQITLDNS